MQVHYHIPLPVQKTKKVIHYPNYYQAPFKVHRVCDGIFTLLRFNDEGAKLTHISESEALWLTLELAPEKMNCI